MPFLIHTRCMPCLSKICTARRYFSILYGHETTYEMVAQPISTAKFYKVIIKTCYLIIFCQIYDEVNCII